MIRYSIFIFILSLFVSFSSHSFENFVQYGKASWYGKRFHGRKTASGERFDRYRFTAAHKLLPFGTIIRVTNLRNGKDVYVRINDRGPYIKGRILDVSRAAAEALGVRKRGVARVKVEVVTLP